MLNSTIREPPSLAHSTDRAKPSTSIAHAHGAFGFDNSGGVMPFNYSRARRFWMKKASTKKTAEKMRICVKVNSVLNPSSCASALP